MTSVLAPIYSSRDSNVFTSRLSSTAVLAIDSEDRFSDYDDARAITGINRSPYDFSITKNQSLMNGFFTRLGVTEIVFPWVIPNINQFTQLVNVVYDIEAGPVSAFVAVGPIGFYTPAQIASRLQTVIRALAPAAGDLGTFSMTYGVRAIGVSSPAQRPIFEYGLGVVGNTIAFEPMPASLNLFRDRRRKQLFDLLGFNASNSVPAPSGRGSDTYCQTTRYVDIVCSQLTANQALKDTMSQIVARDVLCRVYVGDAAGVQSTVLPSAAEFCPPGCMPTTIYKDYSQPKQIQWIPNQPVPGYLRFEVFDDAGYSLTDYVYEPTTANASNWSMTMLVTEN